MCNRTARILSLTGLLSSATAPGAASAQEILTYQMPETGTAAVGMLPEDGSFLYIFQPEGSEDCEINLLPSTFGQADGSTVEIFGTDGNDSYVEPTAGQEFCGMSLVPHGMDGAVDVKLGDGDDLAVFTTPTWVYGGAGDDVIKTLAEDITQGLNDITNGDVVDGDTEGNAAVAPWLSGAEGDAPWVGVENNPFLGEDGFSIPTGSDIVPEGFGGTESVEGDASMFFPWMSSEDAADQNPWYTPGSYGYPTVGEDGSYENPYLPEGSWTPESGYTYTAPEGGYTYTMPEDGYSSNSPYTGGGYYPEGGFGYPTADGSSNGGYFPEGVTAYGVPSTTSASRMTQDELAASIPGADSFSYPDSAPSGFGMSNGTWGNPWGSAIVPVDPTTGERTADWSGYGVPVAAPGVSEDEATDSSSPFRGYDNLWVDSPETSPWSGNPWGDLYGGSIWAVAPSTTESTTATPNVVETAGTAAQSIDIATELSSSDLGDVPFSGNPWGEEGVPTAGQAWDGVGEIPWNMDEGGTLSKDGFMAFGSSTATVTPKGAAGGIPFVGTDGGLSSLPISGPGGLTYDEDGNIQPRGNDAGLPWLEAFGVPEPGTEEEATEETEEEDLDVAAGLDNIKSMVFGGEGNDLIFAPQALGGDGNDILCGVSATVAPERADGEGGDDWYCGQEPTDSADGVENFQSALCPGACQGGTYGW